MFDKWKSYEIWVIILSKSSSARSELSTLYIMLLPDTLIIIGIATVIVFSSARKATRSKSDGCVVCFITWSVTSLAVLVFLQVNAS